MPWRDTCLPLAAAALLAGCADGYPSEDRPLASPHDLDNPGRLAVMNEIGRDAHPANRTRYSLENGCVLRVETRRGREKAPAQDVPLARPMEAEVRFDKDAGTYGVWAQPDGPQLLEARRFHPASQFQLLLRLVARDCAD